VSKLLPTSLPFSQGDTVSSDTFNRLVRVLEINLSAQDPDATPHFNATEISELQFATGAIIFNTTVEIHQAFDGNEFRDLYVHKTYLTGISGTLSVGSVTVTV